MRTPAVIRFDGPEPYIDPAEGTETPEWYVFAADALGDPTGKVTPSATSTAPAPWPAAWRLTAA